MLAAARLAGIATSALAEALPLVALAQPAGEPVPGARTYGWVWLVAAAVVVFVLVRMFFSRSHRTPRARGP